MIGRLDDWMKVLVEKDNIALDPDAANWAGVAAFKRAYGIYQERGYRTRLLAAAYRHRLHWTELVGARRRPDDALRLAGPVQRLRDRPEPADRGAGRPAPHRRPARAGSRTSCRAYEPDGLAADEFAGYGATVRTLRGFVQSYHDLQGVVRDIMMPNPDVQVRLTDRATI